MKLNRITSEFPNIYRFITEKKGFKSVFEVLGRLYFQALLAVLFFLVIVLIILSALNFDKAVNLTSDRKQLESKVRIWEDVVKKYPGHKEAYFQTALTHFRLKNFDKAIEYLNKALLVDPDFEEAKILKSKIENY